MSFRLLFTQGFLRGRMINGKQILVVPSLVAIQGELN
jgi:hypothetical protein